MSTPDTDDAEFDSLLREAVAEKAAKALPAADAVSRPPGFDPRPMPHGGRDLGAEPSPRGPEVNVRGVGLDVMDPATKGVQALDVTERNLRSAAAALAGGGLASGIASRLPGVSHLLAAEGLAPQLAGAGIAGAAGGVGSAAAGSAAQGELPSKRDLVTGAVVGGALGIGGRALGHAVETAPVRDGKNILTQARASGMSRPDYAKFFGSREGAVRTLRGDPELRAALGKPDQMLPLVEQRFGAANGAATKIMDSVDATNGRIPTTDVRKAIGDVFTALEKTGGEASANPAAAAAYKLAQQFSSGIGKSDAHPPSSAEIRRFLTEEVGAKLNTNPNVEDSATDRAAGLIYGRLKDLLSKHAEAASPEFAKELATLNEKQATYSMLRDAANKRAPDLSTGDAPKAGGLVEGLKHLAVPARATVGHTVGKYLAGATGIVEPETGGIVGGVVGAAAPVIKRAAGAAGARATSALATPAGQRAGTVLGPVAKSAAHVLVPQIVQLAKTGDRKGAQKVAADAVYGE